MSILLLWGSGLVTYTTLQVGIWVVEVFQILIRANPGTHGADIEAEQGTANGAEASQDCDSVSFSNAAAVRYLSHTVDIRNAIHDVRRSHRAVHDEWTATGVECGEATRDPGYIYRALSD